MDVEKRKAYEKAYYVKNKERINKKSKRRYANNCEVILKQQKEYYQKHIEYKKQYAKKYYQRNKGRWVANCKPLTSEQKEYIKRHNRERYKLDNQYRIRVRLSRRLCNSIRGYIKTDNISTRNGKNIDYKSIIEHLKPFPKDIENYHVDHIIPLSFFDLTDEEQLKKACNPINFQWLKCSDNHIKSDTIDFEKYPEQKAVISQLCLYINR